MEAPLGASVDSALEETWGRVDAFLRARLRPELFERWFASLRPARLANCRTISI